MYTKQISEMTADEITAIQEREREDERQRREIQEQHAKIFAEREARIEAQRKIDAEIRLGQRPKRQATADDDAHEVLCELLGDLTIPFALAFAGMSPHGQHARFARLAAAAPGAGTASGARSHGLVAAAEQRARRKIELAEGVL